MAGKRTLAEAEQEVLALKDQIKALESAPATDEQLKAENEALKVQLEAIAQAPSELQALKEENEALKAKVEELQTLLAKEALVSKAVPGTYYSKKHKKTIAFKDGARKTRVGLEVIDSAELIKNENNKYTDALDNLIELGASFIVEVEK